MLAIGKIRLAGLLLSVILLTLLAACGETSATSTSASTGVKTATTGATTSAGQTNPTAGGSSAKIKVVATTTQIGDFVKNVGGDKIELYTILKPGLDAHEFEPTVADSKALGNAQVIFSNGLDLEEWLAKTIQNSGTKGVQVVCSEGAVLLQGSHEHSEAAHEEHDPHIWFSTENAKIMVNNISAGLSKVDPTNKAGYETNAKNYIAELDKLTKEIKDSLATIPAERRKLVTNHDAFGYYADQFKLKIVGSIIPSFDTNAEPSAQELGELVKKIKAEKVPAIFTESSLTTKLAEQIAKEAGVKIIANLYSDSLGAAGSDGDTYIKMMQANTKNIVNGLQ